MSELVILPFQNAFRRGTAQTLVRLIDRRQQLDIGSRVALRKTVPAVAGFCHLPVFAESSDEPVHLRTTQARHLDQVLQKQSAHCFGLSFVLLRSQRGFDPTVNLFPVQRLQAYCVASRQKLPDLLEGERLGSLHDHLHRPAVSPRRPSPPSLPLRCRPSHSFSIILYWKPLPISASSCIGKDCACRSKVRKSP
jgi:hypothetical protein